ncbi:hypothetical protein CDAR_416411 [Caerostris darwini]|uniref:Uncharacterized protein n=1 Tax=Caerostris darwini TaxID=1538125 RepID=A0AAV4W8X0_9ARAC|nr:hypothetical protein CDAR_416411 [Caerostris darwini]
MSTYKFRLLKCRPVLLQTSALKYPTYDINAIHPGFAAAASTFEQLRLLSSPFCGSPNVPVNFANLFCASVKKSLSMWPAHCGPEKSFSEACNELTADDQMNDHQFKLQLHKPFCAASLYREELENS